MSNVIDSLPEPSRSIFIEVVGKHDPDLLTQLHNSEAPSPKQKEAVEKILLDTFLAELGPDDEPTEHGRLANRALATFYETWPND